MLSRSSLTLSRNANTLRQIAVVGGGDCTNCDCGSAAAKRLFSTTSVTKNIKKNNNINNNNNDCTNCDCGIGSRGMSTTTNNSFPGERNLGNKPNFFTGMFKRFGVGHAYGLTDTFMPLPAAGIAGVTAWGFVAFGTIKNGVKKIN